MIFLIDQQLPPYLAQWLTERGNEAIHVRSIGLKDADDRRIWDEALARGMTIVTKDEDFSARRARQADGPAIVWLRLGNATSNTLIAWLAPRLDDIEASLNAGASVVEVR